MSTEDTQTENTPEENTSQNPVPKTGKPFPLQIDLVEGQKYSFCTCGLSTTLPLCDGAHKEGGQFRPITFKAEENKEAWICQCMHSKTMPYCDGTHKCLMDES